MNPTHRRLYLLSLAVGICASTPVAASTLAERSPFLPPNYGENTAPPPPQATPRNYPPVVFYGYSGTPDNREFAIHDPINSQVIWLKEGESKNNYSVTGFNEIDEVITLNYNGMTKQITLNNDEPIATPIPQINNNNQALPNSTRTIVPRRRVILPTPTSQTQSNNNSNSSVTSTNQGGNSSGNVTLISNTRLTSSTNTSNQTNQNSENSNPRRNNTVSLAVNTGSTNITTQTRNTAVTLLSDKPNADQDASAEIPIESTDTQPSEVIPRRRFIPARVDTSE